jgi:hypothetical protein
MLLRLAMTCAALALGLTSCGSSSEREEAPARRVAPRAGSVVARVNSQPIFARDVRAQIKRSGQSPKAALEALIRLELLAAEAARRGLRSDPRVVDQRRRQLATTLLYEVFGKTLDPKLIPQDLIARAYRMNKLHYKRPALVRVKHVLCSPKAKKTPATIAGAKRCIEAAHRLIKQAGGKMTPDEFELLGKRLWKIAEPASVRVESLRTPKRGYTVAAFSDAAFALKRPGDISPPVKTSFGWHIIYLLEHQPGRNLSLAEADPEIRKKIYPEASRLLFDRWAKKLEQKHGVETDLEALTRAFAAASATAGGR